MSDPKKTVNYEALYRETVGNLVKLKTQADNAGNNATAIGALADTIGALAIAGVKLLEAADAPTQPTVAKTPGAPAA